MLYIRAAFTSESAPGPSIVIGPELRVVLGRPIGVVKVDHQRHQSFGNEAAAEFAKRPDSSGPVRQELSFNAAVLVIRQLSDRSGSTISLATRPVKLGC
jgi:hypothetical protein